MPWNNESTIEENITLEPSAPFNETLTLYLYDSSEASIFQWGHPSASISRWGRLLKDKPTKTEDDITTYPLPGTPFRISEVGGWEVPEPMAVVINGTVNINIWAQSDVPTIDVIFYVYLTMNGKHAGGPFNSTYTIKTEIKSIMDRNPVEFVGSATVPQLIIESTDKLGIDIWIGRSISGCKDAGVKLLCGSMLHQSCTTFTVASISS